MSKLRSVNTKFWEDHYVENLDPIEKLLFLYLLTNSCTNMLGIYEISLRRIAFDTGIDRDMVVKIFERFDKKRKASYVAGHVMLHNFHKHQNLNNNMKASALNTAENLPDVIKKHPFTTNIVNVLNGKKGEPLPNPSEGFESLSKGSKALPNPSEPMPEYELEYESEYEGEGKRAKAREAPPSSKAGRGKAKPNQQSHSTPGIPPFKDAELETEYQRYLQYMEKEFGRPVKMFQEEEQREFLKNQPDPVAVIKQTLRGGYMKLFPVEKTKKSQEDEWNEEILRRQKDCPMMN